MSQPEILITGVGATTPLAGDAPGTWAGMLAGVSGVRRLTAQWADELPVRIAATAAVEPETVLDRVTARTMDRSAQFALVAAREAWTDAGSPQVDPERLAVVIASGIGGVLTLLAQYDIL
ncbi:MAG: beta-ketoacyl synthase N-terminal-like domain-containing protein, partial [Mycobacteriales bacterium]